MPREQNGYKKETDEKAVYACLNYGESYCPEEIADRSICIDGDIGEGICFVISILYFQG